MSAVRVTSKLNQEQQQALRVELLTQIYATAWQVIAWVNAQWQIEYEVSAMQKLLKRLGFSYKKNRLLPSQAVTLSYNGNLHLVSGVVPAFRS